MHFLCLSNVMADEINEGENYFFKNTNLTALFESEAGFGITEGEFQKFEFILEPELEIELPYNLKLTFIGRAKLDAFDELGFGDNSQPTYSNLTKRYLEQDHFELQLRELYIDGTLGEIYLRLGKQQIVWGKSDGLKVLDIVNPQSFREFILDDFDDSRIPLWTVNIEIPIREMVFQFVWIPDRTYHELADSGSIFEITSKLFVPEIPPGVKVKINSPERPESFFSDSDVGARLSTFWKGWDITLNYFYHYDDIPVLFQNVEIISSEPFVTITPKFKRTHLVGGSFSNAFGNLTLRGEVGYSFNQYYISEEFNSKGIEKGDELSYVLGLDWFGFTDSLISFQLFQSYILNTSDIVNNKFDNTVSLLIERKLMNEALEFEVLWLQNINEGDGLIRPKVSFELKDNLLLKAGIDIFYGDKEGFFGQFREADRFIFGLEYGLLN